MRDLFVAAVVFGSIPFILRRPWLGILMWSWLGYMNPHRLAWGFVTTMPVALIIALTTFVAMLVSKEKKEIPWTRETVLLLIFTGWMFVSTLMAQYPGMAWPQWDKVWRIILMTYVTMMLINNRERVHWLVVLIALSIGFYGFKGGTFIIMGGAGNAVMGPSGSFIADNNAVGLALIMIIPLLWYVRLQTDIKLVRTALLVGGALTLIGIIGTNSRGALLGLAAMGLFFIMKARNRFGILLALIPVALVVSYVMPQEWFDRMDTIKTYDEDASAMGRIYAWKNAITLANMYFVGGGFRAVTGFGGTDSHSNWFGVLGELGWVGLGMFILLHVFTWLSARQIIQWTKPHESLNWARDLAAMVQVSLIGYMSAGSFLGLQYFDLFYHLIAIIVVTKILVQKELDAMRGRNLVMPASVPNGAIAGRPPPGREQFSVR